MILICRNAFGKLMTKSYLRLFAAPLAVTPWVTLTAKPSLSGDEQLPAAGQEEHGPDARPPSRG